MSDAFILTAITRDPAALRALDAAGLERILEPFGPVAFGEDAAANRDIADLFDFYAVDRNGIDWHPICGNGLGRTARLFERGPRSFFGHW